MLKLIASDLDGTLLLNNAQELNPEIYEIVMNIKEKGILFVSASGRQLSSQQTLFAPIADKISYIAENGAFCFHKGEYLFVTPMEENVADSILDYLETQSCYKPLISCPSTCYIKSGDDEFFSHVKTVMHNDVTTIDDFYAISEPILKIALFIEDTPEENLLALRKLNFPDMKVLRSAKDWFDFVPTSYSKGSALSQLLDLLDIKPEEVLVFGDQENDIEMFKVAGTSYVMEKGAPKAKECATYVTNHVESTLRKILDTL